MPCRCRGRHRISQSTLSSAVTDLINPFTPRGLVTKATGIHNLARLLLAFTYSRADLQL